MIPETQHLSLPVVQAWPARRRLVWTRVVLLGVSPALAGLAAPCATNEGLGIADVVEVRARARALIGRKQVLLPSYKGAISARCILLYCGCSSEADFYLVSPLD